jgi:hypothetical protein
MQARTSPPVPQLSVVSHRSFVVGQRRPTTNDQMTTPHPGRNYSIEPIKIWNEPDEPPH